MDHFVPNTPSLGNTHKGLRVDVWPVGQRVFEGWKDNLESLISCYCCKVSKLEKLVPQLSRSFLNNKHILTIGSQRLQLEPDASVAASNPDQQKHGTTLAAPCLRLIINHTLKNKPKVVLDCTRSKLIFYTPACGLR